MLYVFFFYRQFWIISQDRTNSNQYGITLVAKPIHPFDVFITGNPHLLPYR
jgi:hypothetical protein